MPLRVNFDRRAERFTDERESALHIAQKIKVYVETAAFAIFIYVHPSQIVWSLPGHSRQVNKIIVPSVTVAPTPWSAR